MCVSLVVRTDIDDITFHDQDRYVSVYLFQGCRLVNNPGMPASTGKCGIENHTVEIIVFDVFNDTFDLGYGAQTPVCNPFALSPYWL